MDTNQDKQYYTGDNFNFKMNDEFMLALALSTRNSKEISVVYWFVKSMDKANIVRNTDAKYLYTKAKISKPIFYRMLRKMTDEGMIIKIDKKTYMINPNMVINHRKSISKDRPQLLALWSEYEKQSNLST